MSDFYAVFRNCEFKCFLKRGGQLELINKSPIDGFGIKGNVYSRTVDRSECERVYKSTPMVRYKGEAYVKDPTRTIDGVKTGEIDEMFINEAGKQDGGAIQFITPFSINQLQEINLLREIK